MSNPPAGLRAGSLPYVVYAILQRRRYQPIAVEQLVLITKVEPRRVSNALQRLKELGAVRLTRDGWTFQRVRK